VLPRPGNSTIRPVGRRPTGPPRQQFWLANQITQAEIVTVDAGHTRCTLQPDKFLAALHEAVASVRRRIATGRFSNPRRIIIVGGRARSGASNTARAARMRKNTNSNPFAARDLIERAKAALWSASTLTHAHVVGSRGLPVN
jgi:hypothetical protein